MVTWENYEEYMCLHTDGELSEADTRALLAFVGRHPELQEELNMFAATRLAPDNTIVFEHKKTLLKPEARTISLGNWRTYSAAAGVALLVAIGAFKWMNRENTADIPPVAVNINTPSTNNKTDLQITPAERTNRKEVLKNSAITATEATEKSQLQERQLPGAYELAAIAPAAPQQLLHNEIATPAIAAMAEVPGTSMQIQEDPTEETKETLAWLPVNEEKKAGIMSLASAVTSKLEKAKTIKEDLKETTLALKVGGKELTINF